MKSKTTLVLYVLLAALMLADLYLIFNVGNPNSLIRPLVPNPAYDVIVTISVSAVIAFLSFFVFREHKADPVTEMLMRNREQVDRLRQEGKSDDQIAESFLAELVKVGRVESRTRKIVLKTLKEME